MVRLCDKIDTWSLKWEDTKSEDYTPVEVENVDIRFNICLPEIKYYNFNYFNKKVA